MNFTSVSWFKRREPTMRFINIIQFLTRISIKKDMPYDPNIDKGIVYFPMVGAIIGLVLMCGNLFFSWIFLGVGNSYLQSILIVVLELVVTGGLHMDGFGDSFDGLFSYRSKDRILDIMKDPRLGTNGLLAIMSLILLKIEVMTILIDYNMVWYIGFMPIISRLGAVFMTYKTIPARENGMGNMFIGKCSGVALTIGIVFTIIWSIGLHLYIGFGIESLLFLFCSIPIVFILERLLINFSYKKIEGITGDILGCGIEASEVFFLIYILVLMRW